MVKTHFFNRVLYKVFNKLPASVHRILDLYDEHMCNRHGKCIVLMCDGGLSSQVYQYVWGQMLIDLGYRVKYDLCYFKYNGTDLLGNDNRHFLLHKFCALPRFDIAPEYLVRHYKKYYINQLNQPPYADWMYLERKWNEPVYLGNYYKCAPNDFIRNIRKYISVKKSTEILDKKNYAIYKKIISSDSVGVHVRRGDMLKGTDRWMPPQIEYFINAVNYEKFRGKNFFFFSDDPKWVIDELVPLLPRNNKYIPVVNNENVAYIDLFLLSSCNYQIASQGSFGTLAFILNDFKEKMLVYPAGSRAETDERLKNENILRLDAYGNII